MFTAKLYCSLFTLTVARCLSDGTRDSVCGNAFGGATGFVTLTSSGCGEATAFGFGVSLTLTDLDCFGTSETSSAVKSMISSSIRGDFRRMGVGFAILCRVGGFAVAGADGVAIVGVGMAGPIVMAAAPTLGRRFIKSEKKSLQYTMKEKSSEINKITRQFGSIHSPRKYSIFLASKCDENSPESAGIHCFDAHSLECVKRIHFII